METSRYCKRPSRLADLFVYGGTHVFLPAPRYRGEKLGRQWSAKDANLFYATVPNFLRPVFVRSWEPEYRWILRAGRNASDYKVYAKVFIGQYILAFAQLTEMSTMSACRYFAETGLWEAARKNTPTEYSEEKIAEMCGRPLPKVKLPYHERWRKYEEAAERNRPRPEIENMLAIAGYAVTDGQAIVQCDTGEPLIAKHLNNWCYEASVPDPRDVDLNGDLTPEDGTSIARYMVSSRFPKSRIKARAWCKQNPPMNEAEREVAFVTIQRDLAEAAEQAGITAQELQNGRQFWQCMIGSYSYRRDRQRLSELPRKISSNMGENHLSY